MTALQHAQKQADIARAEAETRLQSAAAQADKDRIESESRMEIVRQQSAADAAAAEARLENAQAQAAIAVAEAEARSQQAHEQAAVAVADAESRLENAQKQAALAVAEAQARWAAKDAECETAHRQRCDTSAALTNVQRALTDAHAQVRVRAVLLCVHFVAYMDCLVIIAASWYFHEQLNFPAVCVVLFVIQVEYAIGFMFVRVRLVSALLFCLTHFFGCFYFCAPPTLICTACVARASPRLASRRAQRCHRRSDRTA
jgi:hypothetical protein